MKATRILSVLTALLVIAPNWSFALESIEPVSKERAKELGLEIRSHAAGPGLVRVELEFETKDELKSFSRADLEIRDGDKLLVSSTLREDRPGPGRVVVSFAADRADLGKITLKVVAQPGERTRIGYEVRAKDFVDAGIGAGAKPQPSKLWAGVSVSSPNSTSNALFTVSQAERLMIGFAVVNDGADPVPFERGDTELVVNGEPLAGFGDVFREGPVWDRMIPGKPFSAALGLGKHFAKPGVYKVQWRGKGFESAVLEFRVVGE